MNIQDTLLDYMEEFEEIEAFDTMGESNNSGVGGNSNSGSGR